MARAGSDVAPTDPARDPGLKLEWSRARSAVTGNQFTGKEMKSMGKHISPADPGSLTTMLAGNEPVLVDCWAPWCKPCFLLERVLEELEGQYRGKLTMVKINLEDHPDVAGSYGVSSLPTLLFFKGGQEVYRVIGAVPKTKIDTVIQKVIAAA